MPETKSDTQFVVRNKRRKRAVSSANGPILIVDDNLDDAKLAERAFHQLNPDFSVTLLYSGRELIAHLQGNRELPTPSPPSVPTLILLDLSMPEMDGFSVLEWCSSQKEFANIPIVVLTNFSELPNMKRAYALGARSFLLKPIDKIALRSVLSSLSILV